MVTGTGASAKGRCCLITGASRGIGAATAIAMARAGARFVGVNYNRSAEAAARVAEAVRAAGAEPVLLQADVTDPAAVGGMVRRFVETAGDLHILVNNAGHLLKRVSLEEASPEFLRKLVALNAESVVYVTQACLPHLRRCAPASIVNVGSIAARTGGGKGNNSMLYAACKGFVHTFTIGLAAEYADAGIRVNGVAPGLIETDFHFELTGRERMNRIAAHTPLKRNGTPEDVARAIVFLAGDESSFITGAMLDVNGGLLMHG
ncbi:MAG: SDR family NAD(P)-dependent oxidoreductase [Phycisphaerae bacterium]